MRTSKFPQRIVARLPRPLWRAFNSASIPLHMIIRTVLSYSTVLITTHKSRRPTISAVVHITAMYIYMHMYLNLPLLLHRIDNHKISLIQYAKNMCMYIAAHWWHKKTWTANSKNKSKSPCPTFNLDTFCENAFAPGSGQQPTTFSGPHRCGGMTHQCPHCHALLCHSDEELQCSS